MDEAMSGGASVVAALQTAGVDAIFALHGVQIDPIFQGCLDLGVRLIDVRHEVSAGFAAEAYARCAHGLGVVAVCPGPGFANAMTSIVNAHVDRTPVLYLVSSNPVSAFESNGLQCGIDHAALARPVTRWAGAVTGAEMLPDAIGQAVRAATTPPRGPVLLDIAADVLAGAGIKEMPSFLATNEATNGTSLESDDVAAGLRLLAEAERPALLIGDRPSPPAAGALRDLVDLAGVPCFSNYGSLGVLADSDDHHGGSLFQFARLPDGVRADVALVIGQPLGFDTPGLRDGGQSWGIDLVRIDADAAEVTRFAPPAIGIVADPEAALVALAAAARSIDWPDRSAWRATVRTALADTRSVLGALEPVSGRRLHPYGAARVVAQVAAEAGATMVGDGAMCKHWLHDALRVAVGGRYLTHGRMGPMGIGAGMSIGAAVATGGPVVCVTGDGAVGFGLGEFEAIARHGLPIVMVVMNNARWGASMGFQLRHGGPERVTGTNLSDADYQDVARALGGHGERVDTLDELRGAVIEALDRGGPSCINVRTHAEGPPPPEVPLLGSHP